MTTRRHSWNHPALIKSRPVNSCLKLHFVMAVLFRCQGRTARSTSAKNIKPHKRNNKYDTERNNCCVRWLGAMKIYEFLSPDFPPENRSENETFPPRYQGLNSFKNKQARLSVMTHSAGGLWKQRSLPLWKHFLSSRPCTGWISLWHRPSHAHKLFKYLSKNFTKVNWIYIVIYDRKIYFPSEHRAAGKFLHGIPACCWNG